MWWQREGMLEQWLRDFLRDALRRRGVNNLLSEQTVDPFDLLSDPRQLGFSSLDMVQLASRFAACLGLDSTGLSDLLLARRSAQGWCEVARRSLGINDRVVGFYSSGSTASPLLSRHSLDKLNSEARFFAQWLLEKQPVQRVVCTVPCHHIYGFIWGMLLPQQIPGVELVWIDTSTRLPTSWASQLREHDLIVATPDSWQLLAQLQIPLPERFTGISSTAPLPAQVAQYVDAQFPHAVLVEIYGSTETAGLGWRSRCHNGFDLLPWWQLQQDGAETVVVCTNSQQRYPLQDRIEQLGDRRIQVRGRQDAVIQIAGHNINLDTLAARLMQHPDISSARVAYRQQDGHLHYFLAIRSVAGELQHWCSAFSDWLVQTLGDVPPPATIVLSSTLPQNSLGKTVVWDPALYPVLTGIFRTDLSP